jgi:hypothetical protein
LPWKKGWIENRRSGAAQVSQLLDYRLLPEAAFHSLLTDPLYSGTGLNHGAVAKLMAQLLNADIADLSNGTVIVCGPDNIQQGNHLEIQLFLSDYHCKLKFLALAVNIHFGEEMKEMVFRAGIKVQSVNKLDMDLLSRVMEKQKGH